MKKIKSFALLTAFALALMTGCSGTTTKNYILATGGTSGTYYPFGGAIANVWNTKLDNMNVTAPATGASAETFALSTRVKQNLLLFRTTLWTMHITELTCLQVKSLQTS